jgi:Mce-associated membrane protein
VARPFLHLADAILLIGYLRPLWHPRRRTFADSALGTVAVETRRPRLQPWLRTLVPGSRAGSVAVTAAAVVVCAGGFLFAFPTSSSGSLATVGDPVACPADVPAGATDVGATAVLQPVRHEGAEHRAWVVRDLAPSGRGFELGWSWTGSLGNGSSETWTEVRVARAGVGRDDALLVEGPHTLTVPGPGTTTLAVDPGDLDGLGPTGWIESSLVLDGTPMATCRLPASAALAP